MFKILSIPLCILMLYGFGDQLSIEHFVSWWEWLLKWIRYDEQQYYGGLFTGVFIGVCLSFAASWHIGEWMDRHSTPTIRSFVALALAILVFSPLVLMAYGVLLIFPQHLNEYLQNDMSVVWSNRVAGFVAACLGFLLIWAVGKINHDYVVSDLIFEWHPVLVINDKKAAVTDGNVVVTARQTTAHIEQPFAKTAKEHVIAFCVRWGIALIVSVFGLWLWGIV